MYYEYRILVVYNFLVIPFLIIGVLFAIFKEKAANLFQDLIHFLKEEQALYDKAHISRDIRNQCCNRLL